jgi:hypothetical protein
MGAVERWGAWISWSSALLLLGAVFVADKLNDDAAGDPDARDWAVVFAGHLRLPAPDGPVHLRAAVQ